MKNLRLLAAVLAVSTLAFTSCKKDYTCTCTTSVGTFSNTTVHDLPSQTHSDAQEACDRFEDDANNSSPGTTNCHL